MDQTGQSDFVLNELPVAEKLGLSGRTYERFQRRYGRLIFGTSENWHVEDAFSLLGTTRQMTHLDEVQSRAMKQALLASVELVDDGFLVA